MIRIALSLIWLLAALLILPPVAMDAGQVLAFGVLMVFTVLAINSRPGRRQLLPLGANGNSAGRPAEERRLHGTFRRHTSPTAPGRPQPRAPGLFS